MSKLMKFIIISLIVMIVFIIAVFLIGNFYFSVNTVEKSGEQVTNISGDDLENDLLIAKSYSYDDHLTFTYVPRTSGKPIDLYADYKLKEDGTTIATGNHRLCEDVSVDKPIVIEVQRNLSSVYELGMSVEDTNGNMVQKSNIAIKPHNELFFG
ncbi:hypothetical protein [Methanolobus vulcani]|uniref:Uncharacterized protein n=1 Tax=Methanolobus vulcani TaxID=38026 RepID=A0A7Z8P2E6_9EURY|nr:hypothetical protein [Methanolobus vulcani]TQD26317.1 hypothetical protein FKV42_06090 [Methanolobus vulcani]